MANISEYAKKKGFENEDFFAGYYKGVAHQSVHLERRLMEIVGK